MNICPGPFEEWIKKGNFDLLTNCYTDDLLALPVYARASLFRLAVREKQKDIAKFLFPLAGDNSELFLFACFSGEKEIIEDLLPLYTPNSLDSEALSRMVMLGYTDLAESLIPLSDPKARSSKPLQMASYFEREHLFNLLYPLSDPVMALEYLQKVFNAPRDKWFMIDQRMRAESCRSNLTEDLSTSLSQKEKKEDGSEDARLL